MNVHIVYCHPSQDSYTYEILSQLQNSLNEHEIEYTISDLYAINFLSDMTKEEYHGVGSVDTRLPLDVLKEHKKINQSDCIIFLYPVWWSDCPAKMKGWFDRVFTNGYAYNTAHSNPSQMMPTINQGIVICTAGHTNEYLEEIGIAQSMRHVMIDDRLGKRFTHKDMHILGGTLNEKQVRSTHSNIIRSIVETLKQ